MVNDTRRVTSTFAREHRLYVVRSLLPVKVSLDFFLENFHLIVISLHRVSEKERRDFTSL